VGVPRPALGIHDVIGAHRAGGFQLRQHDDDAVALDHTERRRVVPEPFIMEAELVAVVVGGADHVVDDEVRSAAPALAVLHDLVPPEGVTALGAVTARKPMSHTSSIRMVTSSLLES